MNQNMPERTRANEPEGTEAERVAGPGPGAPGETRKPYARPRLTVHGQLRTLTLGPSVSVESDRNVKEAFEEIDPRAVLAGVVALPIERWSYKGETARHLGPMAQDFAAAFGLGQDDRHIFPLDAAGVTLAALQGLHALVQSQAARLETLERELAALRAVAADLRIEFAVREQEPVA